MLNYGKNIALLKPLPELKKPEPNKKFLFYLKSILDFVGDLFVTVVTEAIDILTGKIKIISELVELALGTIKDIVVGLITEGEVDWKSISKNSLWRLGTISYAFLFKKIRNFIKIIPQFKKINKTTKIVKQVVSFAKNPASIAKFLVNKSSYNIAGLLFKKGYITKNELGSAKKIINKIIRFTSTAVTFSYGLIKAKNKEEYLINRISQVATLGYKKYLKKIVKKISLKNFFKLAKKNNKSTKKYQKLLKRGELTWIPLDSKWIDGVKIASSSWIENSDDSFISFYIFFNPLTTKNKKALLFIDRPIEEFNDLLNASSKGKYYLDNFSWGWEIGKAIRLQDKNIKTKFWIEKIEQVGSKYNQHFLKSLKDFENTNAQAIEAFRDQFKILSSTRNRRLGNKIVVEFNNKNVRFYGRMTEKRFNSTFKVPGNIKRISGPKNIKIKRKKL